MPPYPLAEATVHVLVALFGGTLALVASYLQGKQALRKAWSELEHAGDMVDEPSGRTRRLLEVLSRVRVTNGQETVGYDEEAATLAEPSQSSRDAGAPTALNDDAVIVAEPPEPSPEEESAARDVKHFFAVSGQWALIFIGALLAVGASLLEIFGL